VNAIDWLHDGLKVIHVAGGMTALAAGTAAVIVRKGGRIHARTGTWFCAAMLVLGVTAAILDPLRAQPQSPLGGIMVCYFIATAWMTARRRRPPARFEKIACAVGLTIGALMIAGGVRVAADPLAPAIPGPGVIFALGGLCLTAGLLDLKFVVGGRLSGSQRVTRHLWRMLFAFFVATGSFFLGQQDILPKIVRGSPVLIVLAVAPFLVMAFWLVRMRFPRALSPAMLQPQA
jgi:hypothetical protein